MFVYIKVTEVPLKVSYKVGGHIKHFPSTTCACLSQVSLVVKHIYLCVGDVYLHRVVYVL